MENENLFICKLQDGTVGFREGTTAGEVLGLYPDVKEAYRLTEGHEAEICTAWEQYWEHSRDLDNEPKARELLAAVCRSVFKRAKEQEEKTA